MRRTIHQSGKVISDLLALDGTPHRRDDGIGGLVGQGQEDLLLGLYGALPAKARHAVFNGIDGLIKSLQAKNKSGEATSVKK